MINLMCSSIYVKRFVSQSVRLSVCPVLFVPGDKQFVCPPGDKHFFHTGEGGDKHFSHTGGDKHFHIEGGGQTFYVLGARRALKF